MCMFCAAIPATLAVGVNANARSRRQANQVEMRGEEPAQPKIPPKAATTVVVAGLVIASVIYHSQF